MTPIRCPSPGRAAGGALALLALLVSAPPAPAQQDFAIRNVRVFDGETVIPGANVVVRDGRISAVGADVAVPGNLTVFDGAGRTLLPGLIDAHTHTPMGAMAETALVFGVTTILDMFTPAPVAARFREDQSAGRAHGRADVFSSSVAVTAPGGHGTQFGVPIPTLGPEDDVDAFIAERVAEGADYIKVIVEDGSAFGGSFSTFDEATVRAILRAVREHDRMAVVHVTRLRDARTAIRAGADGLVHVWADELPTEQDLRELAERGVFVVPTLVVMAGMGGRRDAAALVEDDRTAPWLGPGERQRLTEFWPFRDDVPASFETALGSVTRLAEAGIPILAGSDAPNPATAHGASLHMELGLLVEAGLAPVDALRAATSAPADAFRLADRGRIAPGYRADLVLVEGDPTSDIAATRAIVDVWKEGRRVDRESFRQRTATALEEAAAAAEGVEPGPISSFEDGTLRTRFGSGWVETTDQSLGGASTVSLDVVEGGAAGTAHALRIRGEIADQGQFRWSGAMFFPGPQPMAPVDLSVAGGVRFFARGDEGDYQFLLFTASGGPAPRMHSFEVTGDWAEVAFRWSDFESDGSDVTGIGIVGGPETGPFTLLIDELELR